MSKALLAGIVYALLSLGAMYWLYTDLLDTRERAGKLALAVAQSQRSIDAIQKTAQQNQAAQAELRRRLNTANNLAATQSQQLEQLKHEYADVKAWADTALPAAIIRLRHRPALSGSAAYRQWLSARSALLAPTGEPEKQRGAQSGD